MEKQESWTLEIIAVTLLCLALSGCDWALITTVVLCFFRFTSWGILIWRQRKIKYTRRHNRLK